jgi:hypothetical protein
MASTGDFDHVNLAGIATLKHRPNSQVMEANTNLVKWLNLGRQISGTFGYIPYVTREFQTHVHSNGRPGSPYKNTHVLHFLCIYFWASILISVSSWH